MTDIDNKAEFAQWRQYHIGTYGRNPSEAEECHDFPIWLAARASTLPPAATPVADLWMHEDMDRDATASVVNFKRKDLQAAYVQAREDLMTMKRRALVAEEKLAAPAVQAVGDLDAVMADANLSNIACMMGNAMYNMSQQEGKTLNAADCELFDNLRKQWDAARDAVRVIQPPPSEAEILREVIRMVRQYPDFDAANSPFGTMMDEALAGKVPALLATIECLASGQPPPSAEPAPFAYVTADHKMLIFADNVEGVTDDPASLEPLIFARQSDAEKFRATIRESDARMADPVQRALSDPRPVVDIVDERYLKAPSTLGEQVKRAQAVIAENHAADIVTGVGRATDGGEG